MKDTVRYFCVLERPATIPAIPYILEEGEKQGWEAASVLFCGFAPVSKLDIKQETITPIYTVIFTKWGNAGVRPPLLHIGPQAVPGSLVAPAAPAALTNVIPIKKPEVPDGPGDLNDGRR
jgi:hypothetical protein